MTDELGQLSSVIWQTPLTFQLTLSESADITECFGGFGRPSMLTSRAQSHNALGCLNGILVNLVGFIEFRFSFNLPYCFGGLDGPIRAL